MTFFPKNPLRLFLSAFGISLGLLFGMEPFGFFLAGGVSAISAYLFFIELKEWPQKFQILWLLLLSQILNFTIFFWIPSSISAISGAGGFISWILFLIYGFFSHVKLFLSFYGWKFSVDLYKKYRNNKSELLRLEWFLFPIWGIIGDIVTPQLFPWFWGNLAEGNLSFSQTAAATGVYGVGFFLLLGGASIVSLQNSNLRKLGILGIVFFGLIWTLGGYRLLTAPDYRVPNTTPNVENNLLKLSAIMIQPNTSPAKREFAENPEYIGQAMSRNLEMALSSSLENVPPPDLIFFPESAIPFHGTDLNPNNVSSGVYSPTFHGLVLYLTYKTGADLLYNELNQSDEGLRNQVTLISSETREMQRYDKRRLLAFGEYLPFESAFPILRSLFKETSRYVQGGSPKPLLGTRSFYRVRQPSPPTPQEISAIQTPGNFPPSANSSSPEDSVQYQILPLICYEAMFPSLVIDSIREARKNEYTILANPTNDSWFSSRVEAWQHAGTSRFRAIEFGLSFVRPTVSGISFVVDPFGRALSTPIESGEIGTRAFLLPVTKLAQEGNTFYSRWGNLPFYLYSIIGVILFPFLNIFLFGKSAKK
ncbi:putative membrane protein [Leptospira broomii serovar Hurstbridge str. 5399]|uniref:Apolipoprotein N-acyltransferase n=1 Tax=Leptospira broomii serovar Hurstbridge str. 5399 TaxID=1049789 RepID=T0GG10_9LEPT|nr:apolipoprotein N-acyltransferase [Leptospira broomii]EQA45779.1 putative membrane protein [Leptospira broomii serovar Hurstbridge str. 5399]